MLENVRNIFLLQPLQEFVHEEKRGLSGAWFITPCTWYAYNSDVLSGYSQSRTLGPPEHDERGVGKKHKPILVEYAEYRSSFSPQHLT